ncbi:hypothetical protein N6L27_11540 [Leisingera sp. SS27]|uniref:hypothetical protein n=1 Tax=Leisingera sp. SS27 TaxID=2979462 RepID=UPI00232BCC4B|nr:hypothetical protein [Leisingera sp. SS27]MDC0658633.1 hypothetical protein [Leisingera sp. SS27]
MELADHGIRVNAVAPAVVVTPIYGAFTDPAQIDDKLTAGVGTFHPIGRAGFRLTLRQRLCTCCAIGLPG